MKKTLLLKIAIFGIGIFALGDVVYAATGSNALGKGNTYNVEVGSKIENLYKQFKNRGTGVSNVNIQEGQIDTSKLGTYHTILSAKNFIGIEIEKNITVHVVDTKKPTITGESTFETQINEPIDFSKKLTVKDNVDKTVELKVNEYDSSKVGVYTVTAIADDSSGNKATKKLTVHVVDTTKPKINAPDTSIEIGQSFSNMEGVSAKDNADGDLTSKLKVTGEVNTSIAGQYTLTYTVSDAEKNEDKVNRVVTVVEPTSASTNSTTESGSSATSGAQGATPQTVSTTSSSSSSQYAANTIYLAGAVIPYQNGGQGSGQSIIDSNPNGVAATWGGASVQSGSDGMNTHFIGHNPGIFSSIFSLGIGSQVIVTDSNGTPTVYHVSNVLTVDDSARGVNDGFDYWDTITGTGGGERVTFQSCITDSTNLIVIATA